MSQFNDPQIILKTFDLYTFFYQEIRKWPKIERYNLGERMENLILDIYENLLFASRNYNKKESLTHANINLQILKNLFRLAKEIGVMEERKYLFFEIKSLEIGRMLGGWLKSI